MMNQTFKGSSEAANVTHQSDSPFIFEFFLVQGVNFRCMAYRDGTGKWRGAFNNMELPGFIRVLA